MTLDDVEKLARAVADMNSHEKPGEAHVATDLARALLAVLPVVRAAGEWRDCPTGFEHPAPFPDSQSGRLEIAIDQMRAALEETP